jgi:hypothetical protein
MVVLDGGTASSYGGSEKRLLWLPAVTSPKCRFLRPQAPVRSQHSDYTRLDNWDSGLPSPYVTRTTFIFNKEDSEGNLWRQERSPIYMELNTFGEDMLGIYSEET